MNYEIIREARINKGLTMKELADKIGKFSSYIAEIESGKRDLRISNIEKICEALDLEIIIRKKTMKTLETYNDYEVKAEIITAGFLHKDYLELKKKRDALYLFDFGGFFVAYDEDAKVVVDTFQEPVLDKVKAGYYITSLRSTIPGGLALKVSELQRKGYEVIIVRN